MSTSFSLRKQITKLDPDALSLARCTFILIPSIFYSPPSHRCFRLLESKLKNLVFESKLKNLVFESKLKNLVFESK